MKLKLIQETKLFNNYSSIFFDNVFSDTYLDYVVSASNGLGNVPSNAIRFIDQAGNEQSSSNGTLHQMYANASAEYYQKGNGINYVYDVFWKYGDGLNIQCIFWHPYVSTRRTQITYRGTANNLYYDGVAGWNQTKQMRGFLLHDYNSSTYYNEGTLSIYGIEY